MYKAIFCIAPTIGQAEAIVNNLMTAGFSNNDISVLFADKSGNQGLTHEKGTKVQERTAIDGAVAFGGGLEWLAGMGSLTIPGTGPFIAAGPIMSALGNTPVGVARMGLAEALIGVGIPEYETNDYQDKIKEGGVLFSVNTASSENRDSVKEIFGQADAENISSTEESSPATTY
ncbi:MAG: hypothetical protein CTY16_12110 [Methylobacter sp.]|nr:MAG: hypothetical protein CTY16_12110 [Methylobacter sp.]